SVSQDGIHHQSALDAGEAAQPGIAPLEFLHEQTVFDIAHSRAAVAFQIRAEKSELAHFRHQLQRKLRFTIRIADHGSHTIVHELPRGLPDHEFLFAELRIDEKIIYAWESSHES